jgi:peptide/nickel transport system permease protein
VTVGATVVVIVIVSAALLAPLIAPHNPYNLASVSLLDATDPPAWLTGGDWSFPLGTDNQGRDVLSTMLYGTRLSLLVGGSAVALSGVLGVALGLIAGWRGGIVDTVIMRIADVQLSFPAILIALLIDGVVRTVLPRDAQARITLYVLVASIALSYWVHFARTVRGSTLVERNKEYIQAAWIIGVHPARIVVAHLMPNVIGPVLVIATINLATAILTEATLSFLGVGLPPTEPSLGTLIRVGNDFLLSGDWWISVFPGGLLALLILSVNLLGDWLRDAFNPKLR